MTLFLNPKDTADILRMMDLHVCSHLDPMEPTGTIGVLGYSHLELVAITTSGDVLAVAGGRIWWR